MEAGCALGGCSFQIEKSRCSLNVNRSFCRSMSFNGLASVPHRMNSRNSSRNSISSGLARWRRLLNLAGVRQKKIFAIGFNKCGTSSLHALFLELGRPSFHGVEWRSCNDMKILKEYDCFSDGIPEDLQKLDISFPGSKFILQLRELDGWIFSRLGHIEKERKNGMHVATEYWDSTDHAVKMWIRQRNHYHLKVLEYFADRPGDLLIVNFIRDEQAANKICKFLGYSGGYTRPHVNVNPSKVPPIEHSEMVKRCIGELGVHDNELSYDIYCPSLVVEKNLLQYPKDSSEF